MNTKKVSFYLNNLSTKEGKVIVYSFGPDRKDDIAAVVFNEEEFPPNYKSPGDIIFNNSSS